MLPLEAVFIKQAVQKFQEQDVGAGEDQGRPVKLQRLVRL